MFGFFSDHFLFFGLKITYYGFIIACAMAFGVWLACFNAKTRKVKKNDLVIIACYALPLAIIGARIYYFIFSLDSYTSFWQIFEIWNGGLAIYGGVIGGALGVGLACLIHKKNFFDIADVAVPSLIFGQAVGRIGCYFAGCCYGIEVTDPNLMWFPFSTQIGGVWHLSTFFYESLWDFATFAVLMLLLRTFKIKQRGAVAGSYLVLYGVGRAWIEALRGDSLYLGSIKVSQLLSIILIAVGLAIIIFYFVWNKKKAKTPLLKNLNKYFYNSKKVIIPELTLCHNSIMIEENLDNEKKSEEKQNKD